MLPQAVGNPFGRKPREEVASTGDRPQVPTPETAPQFKSEAEPWSWAHWELQALAKFIGLKIRSVDVIKSCLTFPEQHLRA